MSIFASACFSGTSLAQIAVVGNLASGDASNQVKGSFRYLVEIFGE
jgi:hypothetical protein